MQNQTEPKYQKAVVGIKKCGCVTSAMDPTYFSKREVAKFIASLLEEGLIIESWDQEEVKAKFGYCPEHRPKPKVEQPKLFETVA
jgi:hypothetical protein